MKRKLISIGIGILVILLALAGTVSARPAYNSNCAMCHNANGSFDGTIYTNIHKFDGVSAPTATSSCGYCHIQPPSGTANPYNMSLTSNGSSYNSTHRYDATTLASVKLAAPGCANCHVDVITNNFNLITGTSTYLTSSVCEDCHKAKYDVWSNTLHRVMLTPKDKAIAMGLPEPWVGWDNISYVIVSKFAFEYVNLTGYFLTEYGSYETELQEFENGTHAGGRYGTCGRCHTTGWDTTGFDGSNGILPGFNATSFSEPGIACERCHGPGGNGHQVVVNYSGDQCRECHTGGNHGTGWELGAHAPPSAEIGSCTTCHSPFDKYANNGTITEENATNVACGVCHNIHDMTDSKYAATFTGGIFDATTWSEVADSKLAFFNATASVEAGTDVFDNLTTDRLIYPGSSSGLTGPINLTGKPDSEVLCSKCHYNHGLAHMYNVSFSHANGEATCIDCHMEGANAKVGKGMMKNHDNEIDSGKSCGGAKCHGTSNKTIIDPLVGNGSESMQKRYDEWGASLHNDKEVGGFAFNQTTGIGKLRANSCNVCKSPVNWNPATDSNYTAVQITTENFEGITCSICHPLHDMGNWFEETFAIYGEEKAIGLYEKIKVGSRYKGTYKLVENSTELCGSCHSNDHPRLKEVGNYAEPGWPSNATNPNSPHGFPAAELFVGSMKQSSMNFECTTCHYATMTRYENGTSMPQNERIRGHSFKWNATILMNGTACSSCHVTGSTLGNLSTTKENIQAETHDKWNVTNITVQSALATIKAYSGEKNVSRDLIAKAYWNLRLVSSDASWGVHNPNGAIELLDNATALAKKANESLGQISCLRGDLNDNGISADAGDLVLMKRASISEISPDSRYDLNNNGILADAGDLVLMKRASIGEINLSNCTEQPVINNVTLNTTSPITGQAILVSVNATDDIAVTSVKANGVPLIFQVESFWNGTIIAMAGTNSVNVSASDAAGNTAWDNSTSYTAT